MACVDVCIARFAANATACYEFCAVTDRSCHSWPELFLLSVVVCASLMLCAIGASKRAVPKKAPERPPTYGAAVFAPATTKLSPEVLSPEGSNDVFEDER